MPLYPPTVAAYHEAVHLVRETQSFKVGIAVTIMCGPCWVCLGHPELWKEMKSPEPVSVPGSWLPHRNTHGTYLRARNLCCLYCLDRRCGLCGEDAVCAWPFTSQHGREGVKTPLPRNSSKPTGRDLSEGPEGKGRDLTQPSNLTGPAGSSPCSNGFNRRSYKGAPPKRPRSQKTGQCGVTKVPVWKSLA